MKVDYGDVVLGIGALSLMYAMKKYAEKKFASTKSKPGDKVGAMIYVPVNPPVIAIPKQQPIVAAPKSTFIPVTQPIVATPISVKQPIVTTQPKISKTPFIPVKQPKAPVFEKRKQFGIDLNLAGISGMRF